MSTINTVAQVRDMDDAEVVRAFRAKIKGVGKVTQSKKFNEDNPVKGEYRFQHLLVRDREGEELDVTLKDRPVIKPTAVGKEITILAHQSSGKHPAWTGCKAMDQTNKKTDKTERTLWVTPSAEVLIGAEAKAAPEPEEDEGSAEEEEAPAKSKGKAKAKAKPEPEPEPENGEENAEEETPRNKSRQAQAAPADAQSVITTVKNRCGAYDALMRIAEDCSILGGKEYEERTGIPMPEPHLQARISSLFIALSRYAETHTLSGRRIDTYRDTDTKAIIDYVRLSAVRGEPKKAKTEDE